MSETVAKRNGFTGVLIGQDVKVRRDLKDLSHLYTTIGVVLICVAVLMGYLWARVTAMQTGYQISTASSARSALIERNMRLKIELEKLKSPERIERIAVKELGLMRPGPDRIIRLK